MVTLYCPFDPNNPGEYDPTDTLMVLAVNYRRTGGPVIMKQLTLLDGTASQSGKNDFPNVLDI